AKQKGKHLHNFYQEKLDSKGKREFMLCSGLNRETIFEELILYYQPVIQINTQTIICMDALVHWQHPELGLIRSAELFNYAERQRKLNTISEWLLQNACKQFLHWRSLGFSPALLGLPISIKQLENSHFIYRISHILQALEFKPEWLLLEIQGDPQQLEASVLEKAFNMLLFMGVKMAIDHFGAGALPLQYLENFTIHYLKLDATLIKDIHLNSQAEALIKSLVFLTNELSMQLIVQGVESDQQRAILESLGCTLMQGHLLAEPLTEVEVVSKLVNTPATL
ncbi:MAG: EAL domain-containing protein, partial [Gammaproteobacteria bacterium]